MSANDLLHLEDNFKKWQDERGEGSGAIEGVDPFTYYCIDQFLKPFIVSDEDILNGVVEGGNDGGLDAAYFFLDKVVINEITNLDSKTSNKVHLIFLQIKNNTSGFSPIEIGKFRDFCEDLLDLTRPATDFKAIYNPRLMEYMRVFKEKYRAIIGNFPHVTIEYFYVTKTSVVADAKAKDALSKVDKIIAKHLNNYTFEPTCVNLRRLLEQVKRRPQREKTLKWSEQPLEAKEGHVGLVKLEDYYKFIQDEKEELNERILEANVRGYQQDTPVNEEIRNTISLQSNKGINFWLLNNGITVLASKAQKAGYLELTLEDPKVVNGLQTSREIFEYFSKSNAHDERKLLVRVIETTDTVLQDAIIKATNRQNSLAKAALRATEEIQQRIDVSFQASGHLWYDRRKGYYKDKGKKISKIISMPALVQAVLSVLLQRPDDARGRPSDYINDDDKYSVVFPIDNDAYPLEMYLSCILLVRKVEAFLRSVRQLDRTEKANLKFYIATLLTCRLTGETEPSPIQIAEIDTESISEPLLRECNKDVRRLYKELQEASGEGSIAKSPEMTKRVTSYIRRSFSQRRN
jgi:hypothetical protein